MGCAYRKAWLSDAQKLFAKRKRGKSVAVPFFAYCFKSSAILHSTFYILHLEETRSTSRPGFAFAAPLRVTGQGRIAQGRGRVAYAARGRGADIAWARRVCGARQGGSAARGKRGKGRGIGGYKGRRCGCPSAFASFSCGRRAFSCKNRQSAL